MQDVLLHVSKWCGLFRLSRHLTHREVRILCYHGFALSDEISFRPSLFISLPTFRQRMQTLASSGYAVRSLEDAVQSLERATVQPDTVVITVDDVFNSFATKAVPILEEHRFPVTVYVTTYYSQKGTPVFRLLMRYAFWKTSRRSLDLSQLDSSLAGQADLTDQRARFAAEEAVINFGEHLGSETERVDLTRRVASLLDIDLAAIEESLAFHIVRPDQIRELAARGIDVQLHTHRHRFPDDPATMRQEIEDNRRVLEPLVGRALSHFCYPSGVWAEAQWPGLQALGITSATTCDVGLNTPETPRLGLKRILDAEDVTPIRFEAEVSGFKELLRRFAGPLRQRGRAERHVMI